MVSIMPSRQRLLLAAILWIITLLPSSSWMCPNRIHSQRAQFEQLSAKSVPTNEVIDQVPQEAPKKNRRRIPFQDRIEQLRNYSLTYGTTLVDSKIDAGLANWTKGIRNIYTLDNGTPQQQPKRKRQRLVLPKEKADQLQALGFVWRHETVAWEQRFQELKAFQNTYGHLNVPKDYPRLGNWVRNQKREYRHRLTMKKPSWMTDERWTSLDSIGFWDTFVTHEARWERRYEELSAFRQKYGHPNVPEDYEDNYCLGQWVMNQRLWYKRYLAGMWTAMTPDRIIALEKLNFTWSFHASNWYTMLERLKEYQRVNDTVVIPFNDTDNRDLRFWLFKQRCFYGDSEHDRSPWMTDKRIQALEEIPGFKWEKSKQKTGITTADWANLFEGIKQKGITADSKAKTHWFDGQNRFDEDINLDDMDEDLIDLWNQEGDD